MEKFIENRIINKFHSQVPSILELIVPTEMPTHGVEVAPRYKAVYDPKFESYIWYDDEPHLYMKWGLDGSRLPLISVTTVIGAWETPFNPKMAEFCAKKKGGYTCNCLNTDGWENMTLFDKTMEIKRAWKQNSKEATDYGTFAHAVMEGIALWMVGTFDGHHVEHIYDLMCDRYDTFDHEIVRTMGRNFIDHTLLPLLGDGVQIIAEPLVYDLDALLAGQSDLVALDHKKKTISILDFKSNKNEPGTKKVYNKMQGKRLSVLDDIDITHYCIQLCLYQRMVQNLLPSYTLGINTILWLNPEDGSIKKIPIDPLDWKPTIDYIMSELYKTKIKLYEIYKIA